MIIKLQIGNVPVIKTHFIDDNSNDNNFVHNFNANHNSISTLNDVCCYFTTDQFKEKLNIPEKMSIIHFNARNLKLNLSRIELYSSELC